MWPIGHTHYSLLEFIKGNCVIKFTLHDNISQAERVSPISQIYTVNTCKAFANE